MVDFGRSGKARAIAYWTSNAILVAELLLGGIWDILRTPQVLQTVSRLGYPGYFLIILGIWKLLGAAALSVPGFPRLKEWAYAGVVFDCSGAIASQFLAGRVDLGPLAYLFVLLGVTAASWSLRPPSRKCGPTAASI
jgi:uncharacterized membrane protein YphA (DoxX/SURF4 family)